MKYLPTIAGVLLGLLFVFASVVVLFSLVKTPPIPEGTPMSAFFAAFGPTGYMTFIKVLELIGGLLVAVPRTRNLGLLILGPIIVNILAFGVFIAKQPYQNGMADAAALLALYLLIVERKAFAQLINRN
jgi:hypothetical protein